MIVLIVDDEDSIHLMLKRMLAPLHAELLAARSVEEAISQMSRIPPPDLVLLDLKLPPYPAEHTLSAIATLRQFNPNLRVVAVSGMNEVDLKALVTGFQVDGFIAKDESLSQQRLLSVVLEQMDKSTGAKDTGELLERIGKIMQAEAVRKTQPLGE